MQIKRWYPQTLFPAFWVILLFGAVPYLFSGDRSSNAFRSGTPQTSKPIAAAQAKATRNVRDTSPSAHSDSFVQLLQDPRLRDARIGYRAQSSKTGRVLMEKRPYAPQKLLRGADILLSATVLSILKPEYRFRTRYLIDGRLRAGVLWGNLVVKGYGDPTVGPVRLGRVANSLFLSGIENITGALVLDDSYFKTGEYTAGRAPDVPSTLYLDSEASPSPGKSLVTKGIIGFNKSGSAGPDRVPLSGLSFNHNLIRVYVYPGYRNQAAELRIDPDVGHLSIFGQIGTGAFSRKILSTDFPHDDGVALQVAGAIERNGAPRVITLATPNESNYFGDGLRSAMVKRGTQVRRQILYREARGTLHRFLNDYSPPVHEIAQRLLYQGIPQEREHVRQTLLRHLGIETTGNDASPQAGLLAIRNFLEDDVGIPADTYILPVDTDFKKTVRLSPAHLVQVLSYMGKEFEFSSEFLSMIRNPNHSRVHAVRNFGPHILPYLRAFVDETTGSSILAGYLKLPNRDAIAFAFTIENHTLAPSEIWNLQSLFLQSVYESEQLSKEP
jgi:serine-type D-Ala-D-Ala carboxypeptidase/endopeptidase (penicillin-binding protein 4)